MLLILRGLYKTALLGLAAYMLGSPAAEGIRPAFADPYLVAFHTEASNGFVAQGHALASHTYYTGKTAVGAAIEEPVDKAFRVIFDR